MCAIYTTSSSKKSKLPLSSSEVTFSQVILRFESSLHGISLNETPDPNMDTTHEEEEEDVIRTIKIVMYFIWLDLQSYAVQ